MPKSEVMRERLSPVGPPSGEGQPTYLQLINMYVPSWGYGGPVRVMFDYAKWMIKDFQVTVFTGDVHHDRTRIPVKSETIQGIGIHRSRVFLPRFAKSLYLHSLSMCVRAAKRIHSSHGPVIVHFSDLRGLVTLYALLLKRIFPRKVILVHSAFGSLYFKRSIRRKVYDLLFMRAFVRLVDLRLVQNEHEHEAYDRICSDYSAKNQSKIILLPLHVDGVPCDSARFNETGKNLTAVRELRRVYGVPEDAVVCVFLGRLHRAKGILRMIDAYLEFSGSCSRQTLLLIVGRDDGFQGETRDYIGRKRIQDKVRVVNNVYENRFDYYFLADVFLGFPTIYEETMLSSIEAMACATPIVVSREADIPFVEEERAGLVIDFGVQTAAEGMALILQDLGSFQVNARLVAARHFSGVATAQKLRALFQMAISGSVSTLRSGESDKTQARWLNEDFHLEDTSPMASGVEFGIATATRAQRWKPTT